MTAFPGYIDVFRQWPEHSEDAPLVFVASVPASTPEEAIAAAKRLGIRHPVIDTKEEA